MWEAFKEGRLRILHLATPSCEILAAVPSVIFDYLGALGMQPSSWTRQKGEEHAQC